MTSWLPRFLELAYSKIPMGKVSCFLPQAHTLYVRWTNRMTKRHGDSCLFLLESVLTQNDHQIVTSKLPTNKQVGLLLAFIVKKEEFDQTKNKKPFHHNHLHLLVLMIVMKVDRQNYWQALQLLLLHFFSFLLLVQV